MKKADLETRVPLEIPHQSMAVHRDLECMTRAVEQVNTIKVRERDNIISSNTSKVIHITMDLLKADMLKDMKDAEVIISLTVATRECIPEAMKAGRIKTLTGVSGMIATADMTVEVIRDISLTEAVVMAVATAMKVHATGTMITIMAVE